MATHLGARALLTLALPTGVDAGEIARIGMEEGLTDNQIIATAATIIGSVNEALYNQYAGMVYLTSQHWTSYRQGGSSGMTPIEGEFSFSDAVRGEHVGNMLPRNDFEDANELSRKYEKRGSLELLRMDVETVADRWRNRVDYDIWSRALTNTENLIGASGYDVPWAIGSGVNVPYIPPDWGGFTFDSTHTHFVFANSSGGGTFATLFNDQIDQLRHHGLTGDITIWVSWADRATIAALSNFVRVADARIQFVGGNASSPVSYSRGVIQGVPGEVFGYYDGGINGMVELRATNRIPTGYTFAAVSYGMNNPANPLAVRIDPEGFGLRPEPQLTTNFTPKVKRISYYATHGVGVNSRLNGVAGFIGAGAGAYVNPVINTN